MNIDDILDDLVEALIVECPGALPDGLNRNRRFKRICVTCAELGFVVSTYPAGEIFVIEISEAPNGGLIAPVDLLRVELKRARSAPLRETV